MTYTKGLCACGCGKPTMPSSETDAKRGYVKGEPLRYAKNHHARFGPTKGYRTVLVNGKHKRTHRLRAEAALGKPLPPGAIVHHVDGSRNEHAPLVICENQAYHLLLHHRTRIVRAGGNPNTDKICGRCKLAKPLTVFNVARDRQKERGPYCRECREALWPALAELRRTRLGQKKRVYAVWAVSQQYRTGNVPVRVIGLGEEPE